MTSRRRPPRELTEGLEPIRIGLLRDDYDEALRRAVEEREQQIARKLELLRDFYGVIAGPDCWRQLCIAMARERFSGFRVKKGRKPPKWTIGVLWMLAGEMRRTLDNGAATQEEAARALANRHPWEPFLSSGRWKGRAASRDRQPWENLLSEYTHMPERYRAVGELAYLGSVQQGALGEWDRMVSDLLEHPTTEEK